MNSPPIRSTAARALRTGAGMKLLIDRRRAAPTAGRLLGVVERWLRHAPAATTAEWSQRIEARRRSLLDDATSLAIVDYGAGRPADQRSADEMDAGVEFSSTVGETCRRTSKPPTWARLLHELVAEYQPAFGVEMGTSLGISGAYQAAALRGGRLLTLEGSPAVAEVATATFAELDLSERIEVVVGRFADTLVRALEAAPPVDYAFIDGHHDEQATLDYFEVLRPHLADGAVVVFDDIHWSGGMARAWGTLSVDRDVATAVDLTQLGIVVTGPAGGGRYRYHLEGT